MGGVSFFLGGGKGRVSQPERGGEGNWDVTLCFLSYFTFLPQGPRAT